MQEITAWFKTYPFFSYLLYGFGIGFLYNRLENWAIPVRKDLKAIRELLEKMDQRQRIKDGF